MSREQVWEQAQPDQLVKGDRVIVIGDTGYLPVALLEETFHKVVTHEGRREVRFKDKDSKHSVWLYDAHGDNRRFYRKVKR